MNKHLLTLCLAVMLAACDGYPDYQTPADESYYIPGTGTVNLHVGPPPFAPEVLQGSLAGDIIVLSDIGETVERVNADGSPGWRHFTTPERAWDLTRWDANTVSYVEGSFVVLLDINTGAVVRRFEPVPGKKLSVFHQVPGGYLIAFFEKRVGGIQLLDESFRRIWANPYRTSWPRGANLVGSTVIVADTFGHRVYGVDIDTDAMVYSYDDYYPNIATPTASGLLVVAEHANRVYYLDPVSGTRTPVYNCHLSPFDNPYSTHEGIIAMENDPAHPLQKDPSDPMSPSVCQGDLYSPNGAAEGAGGVHYVASTDDGLVLEIDAGGNVAAVVGHFNNPTRILPVTP